MSHGLAEGREKLQRSLQLALDAGLEDHAAVAYCNLVSSSHEIRDYETAVAHLEAGRAFCDEHDLLAWDTYLGGWEAHIALDHGRWSEAEALAGANLERTRGSLPHSRFRSLLVAGVLHARRGDEDPWPRSTRRWRSPSRRTSWIRSVPWPSRGRRRAGSRARPTPFAEETDDTLVRAERRDHRWPIGELAIWRHRAGLPHAGGERLPPPYRAELAGDVRAAAQFWAARGLPLRRRARARHQRGGGRSA